MTFNETSGEPLGEPIGEPSPGYCGVCPNQEWLRKEILDKVTR